MTLLKFSYRRRILDEHFIDGKERYSFDKRLGDKKSVEWILVDWRETVHSHSMFAGHGELSIAVIQEATPQQARIDLKVVPVEPTLDSHFSISLPRLEGDQGWPAARKMR